MAKTKKEITGAIEVTLENMTELCATIPTARPTSEFSDKPGIIFNKETEEGITKVYVFVGESVIETEGTWEKA
jgi:hypothetical protein